MILSDSHCHLHMIDLADFEGDLDRVLSSAEASEVGNLLCVGTKLADTEEIIKIANRYTQSISSCDEAPAKVRGAAYKLVCEQRTELATKSQLERRRVYPKVSASVGLHPNEPIDKEPTAEDLLLLADHPKIVAIGETGLDYYRSEEKQPWQLQRFRNHIQAAIQCKKPIIIHTRAARKDTLRILREENANQVGGVFHCFTEDWETAKAGLDLGFYISFSGIVTFKNAAELQAVAKKIPIDRLLIETDAPFLAPVPHRGKMNHPALVRHVAEFIAGLRGETLETIAEKTTENYLSLFKSKDQNKY